MGNVIPVFPVVADAGRGLPFKASQIDGRVDEIGECGVRGWVHKPNNTKMRLKVQLWIDKTLVCTAAANRHRDDLKSAGIGDGLHAFHLSIPPRWLDGQQHLIHVKTSRFSFDFDGPRTVLLPRLQEFSGCVDAVDGTAITGWAKGASDDLILNVELRANGVVLHAVRADEPRPDISTVPHGFRFSLCDEDFSALRAMPIEVWVSNSNTALPPSPSLAGSLSNRIQAIVAASGIGEAALKRGLTIVGWFLDRRDHSHRFIVEAWDERDRVVASGRTGRLADVNIEGRKQSVRCGFQIELPRSLLDGNNHSIRLTFDGAKSEIGLLVVDGAVGGGGSIDVITSDRIQGWAISYASPNAPAAVEVLVDGKLFGAGPASKFRPDVANAMRTTGMNGFSIQLDRTLGLNDLQGLIVRLQDTGQQLRPSPTVMAQAKTALALTAGEAAEADMPAEGRLEGTIDRVDRHGASGWALDLAWPTKRVRVNLRIGDQIVASGMADALRPDVGRAHKTDGHHGFHIAIPRGLGLRSTAKVIVESALTGKPFKESPKIVNFAGPGLEHPRAPGVGPRCLSSYLYRSPAPAPAGIAPPRVAVIIINRNGASHLEALLKSFALFNAYPHYRIIVVDHGSTDDSWAVCRRWAEGINVLFLQRGHNYSFSQSNNYAVDRADEELVLFLNNDIVLSQCVLSPLVRILEDQVVGMVGIKLRSPPATDTPEALGQREGFLQHLGIKFDTRPEENPIAPYELPLHPDAIVIANSTWLVPGVTAAAMMMRRQDFTEVGGFDEGYFYSYEDVDLCMTLRGLLKKQIVCANDVTAFHHRGATRAFETFETRQRYARNKEHLRERFGAALRQQARQEALAGKRFLNLDPLRIAFAVSTTDMAAPEADFFTAYELGGYLAELHGWEVRYLAPSEWYNLEGFDVIVAMRHDWNPRNIVAGNARLLRVAWARNWFDRWLDLPWLSSFDLIWSGSQKASDAFTLRSRTPVDLMRIATNERRFGAATPKQTLASDYCFTGSFFGAARDVISMLDPEALAYDFALFGHSWDKIGWVKPHWRGALPYTDLPEVYASTQIVLDDANHTTKAWGSINSRVFDALASGALVFTNGRVGSDEVFDGLLPVYSTKAELTALLETYLEDGDARHALVENLRGTVLAHHTYRHRAEAAHASLGRLMGSLRFSIRDAATQRLSALDTAAMLVGSSLQSCGVWVRQPSGFRAAKQAEQAGDDVVIHVSVGEAPRAVLAPDQVHVRLHFGAATDISVREGSLYDLLVFGTPSDTAYFEQCGKPVIPLFESEEARECCLSLDGDGILLLRDAGALKHGLDQRLSEIMAAIGHINAEKTTPRRSQHSATDASVDETIYPLALIDIVFYPDYRATNPYQHLLYSRLPDYLSVRPGSISLALEMQQQSGRSSSVIFHLHWTSPIIGMESTLLVARASVEAFLRELSNFIQAGGRLIWTVHNIIPHEAPFPELEAHLCQRLAALASTIHVHSEQVPALVSPFYELPSDKLVVGPHGSYVGSYPDKIDRKAARRLLSIPKNAVMFLFIGQIRSYKGVDCLLSAFTQLKAQHPTALLRVVGNPVNLSPETLAKLAQPIDGVDFILGHLPDEDLQRCLSAADFVVLPYRKVLTSGSAYLAMSFGVPVIAPSAGLMGEVIEHRCNGLLYRAEDDDALASALITAASTSPSERAAMRASAKQKADSLDWTATQSVLARHAACASLAEPESLLVGQTMRRCFVRTSPSLRSKPARVAAIVLHYAHLDDTIRCVSSLLAQSGSFHVVVVSNDEDARSFAHLASLFPDCTIVQTPENLGYAGGNNIALALLQTITVDYIWLLNPDTVVPGGFLQRMVEIADTHDQVSIFGSKIVFGDQPDVVWFGGGTVDWEDGLQTKHMYIGQASASVPDAPFVCDYVTGASLFYRREVLRDAGLLPEQYFLYFEETHWCLAARKAGHQVMIFPQLSLTHHKRSEAEGVPTPVFLYYYCRNALLMCASFRPDKLDASVQQIGKTATAWLDRVRATVPARVHLSAFAVQRGISDGLAGRDGRVDIEAAFQIQDTQPHGRQLVS